MADQSRKCPHCGRALHAVYYEGGYLNEEQFASIRAGDFYCENCPGWPKQYRYFWKRDLVVTAPPARIENIEDIADDAAFLRQFVTTGRNDARSSVRFALLDRIEQIASRLAPPAAGEGETLASRIEDALDWAVRAGVDRQTLVERLRIELAADRAAAPRERADPSIEARPESEWHEDDGAALWWKFPVVEPPYVGSPLDDDFPDYVTHWTRIAVPTAPSASTSNAITMAMLCLGNRPGATTRREVVETEERADG